LSEGLHSTFTGDFDPGFLLLTPGAVVFEALRLTEVFDHEGLLGIVGRYGSLDARRGWRILRRGRGDYRTRNWKLPGKSSAHGQEKTQKYNVAKIAFHKRASLESYPIQQRSL
jgi:hypothetical protein